MNTTDDSVLWNTRSAAPFIAVPGMADNKYSRGVLGVCTGSKTYPGAAVLSVEGAARTGIGMIRYIGPGRAQHLVLARRPETVTVAGKVQAWLVGSGMDAENRTHAESLRLHRALTSGCPVVIDAGALDLVTSATGAAVITPHARELATMLLAVGGATDNDLATFDRTRLDGLTVEISADPSEWAKRAADEFGVTVLLKGTITHVVTPADDRGARFHARVASPTAWLATAGTGDVLAGILGALLATHSEQILEEPELLGPLAATAALLHGLAAQNASGGGPITALDVAEALPATIASIL